MTALSQLFARPIAHRGLHGPGAPENSLGAVRAAMAAGYAIEVDVQPAADGRPVVFHDAVLDRLTAETGPIDALRDTALQDVALRGGADERIPPLSALLDLVAGAVPLFVEIKGDAASLSDPVRRAEFYAEIVMLLRAYGAARPGRFAVMSFDRRADAVIEALRPETLCAGGAVVGDPAELAAAFDARTRFDFLSLSPALAQTREAQAVRADGRKLVVWTIRSQAAADAVASHIDQITFEGFHPPAA